MGELILKFEIVIPDFRLLKIVSSKRLVLLLALCDVSKRGYPDMVISVTLLWLWAWKPRPLTLKGAKTVCFWWRKKPDVMLRSWASKVPEICAIISNSQQVALLSSDSRAESSAPMTSVNASSTVHEFWVTPFFFFFLLLSFCSSVEVRIVVWRP